MEDVHRTKLPILDAEAQAAQLNSALPISVTAENLEKHPNMSKLLEDLTHRLTPTGMRKETHAKFIQAKHSMHHARQKYLEEATFYRLIQDVLYWNTPDGKQGSTHRMAEALTLSELQDHLQLLKCGGSDSTSCDDIHKENFESSRCDTQQYAFGLNPEVVVARSKACVSDKGIRDTASAIEEHLENEWTRIASFRDPVGFVSYDPDEVAKIPKELEQKSRAVAAEKNKLIQSVLQNDYLFLQTLEQLIEYGSLLRNLMVSKRLCHYTHEHTDSLMTQMSALLLKLKSSELAILVDTYTNQSIPALKLTARHIEERMVKAKKALVQLQHEFSSFDGLDSRYKELLEDYAKIVADIEMFRASAEKV